MRPNSSAVMVFSRRYVSSCIRVKCPKSGHSVNPASGHAPTAAVGHFHGMGKAANGLARLRALRGWTQQEAADAAGLSLGGYRKLEYGTRELGIPDVAKFARVFGASELDVIGGESARPPVPLVGFVGAGAEAHYYGAGQELNEFVDAPDGATAATRALEIRGTSLGELFDRWLVFYDDVRSPVTADLHGRLCVVGLPDDRVLVKKLTKSRSPGLFHLLSNTEAPILDAEVLWAARVKHMVPR